MHADATRSEKPCSTCEQEKPIAEFAIKNKVTGQRQSVCRACQKLASQRHYQENKAERIAQAAARTAERQVQLRAHVAEHLAGAACACGCTKALTFQVKPGYTGPRVSAAVNTGMAIATLEDAIANSVVMCKACQWAANGEILKAYNQARRDGSTPEPKRIPKAEYKRRHTRVTVDRRKQRFEREGSQPLDARLQALEALAEQAQALDMGY